MRLTFEIEGEGEQPPLPSDGADLVALMSFAVSRGFGAQHPLIALADRLHDVHHVRLGPLTTFYERNVEDSEDAEKLELAWQPAAPLRETVEGLARALEEDEQARAFARRGGAAEAGKQAAALIGPLRRAERAGARVRLSYAL